MIARKIAAEFLGSLLLTGVVVGSGIMGDKIASGNVGVALLINTIATAGILFVLIHALAPISGAHFNPAVSLVMVLKRELSAGAFVFYVAAQIAGCCAGAILAHALYDLPLMQISEHVRSGPAQALSEGAATFALLFCILMVSARAPQAVPIAVALTITAGYLWTSSTSFANPAITVARMLTNTFSGIRPEDALGFIAAQCAGALAAWIVCGWLSSYDDPGKSAAIRAAPAKEI